MGVELPTTLGTPLTMDEKIRLRFVSYTRSD